MVIAVLSAALLAAIAYEVMNVLDLPFVALL